MIKDKLYQGAIEAYKAVSRYYTFNVRQVKVETTKLCNLKCPHCRRNYSFNITKEGKEKNLTPGDLWRIIASTNMEVVRFEGEGEPTCNPYFYDLVRMCSSMGIKSAMTTNATLLNLDRILELEKNGMKRIHVSFDGIDKGTYEASKVGADYDKVLHNCSLIGASNIQLFMNVLLANDNIVSQLPEYVELAKRVKATGVHLMKLQQENLEFGSPPDLSQHIGAIESFKEKAKKEGLLYVSTCTSNPTFSGCDDAYICPYILINGDVYACSYMANLRPSEVYNGKVYQVPARNYCMGNLSEAYLKDIWFGNSYSSLRKFLRVTKCKFGTELTKEQLEVLKNTNLDTQFSYCSGCLSRWGESGI